MLLKRQFPLSSLMGRTFPASRGKAMQLRVDCVGRSPESHCRSLPASCWFTESREASVLMMMGCTREMSCSVHVCGPCVLVSQVSSSQVMSMICVPSWW